MTKPFAFLPIDPAVRRDPYALYARGRREFPVFEHEGLPVRLFSVFRHADCEAILRDADTWSNSIRSDQFTDHLGGEELPELPPPSMLGTDGAEHARLRALVNKAFTPRIIQRLEPRMHAIASELVEAAVERRDVDLVQALTYPLPVTIIAEIIGVPAEDREQFKRWSDQAVALLGTGFFGNIDRERLERQAALIGEMHDYFIPLAEERARAPREDLLTGLVQARHEGSRLNHDEMLAMLVLILVAGNETTTTLIGNAVLELLAHPEELKRLRGDPGLLSTAIEEVLRFSSPVQFDPRRATRDLELGGQQVREDDFVLCWIASANRDESVFERADVFDVGRPKGPHLALGFGAHYCLGANLARLEARVALDALLARTRSFERTDDDELPLHASPVFRAVTQLPVRLEPA
ncbi:MAG: cytochrome P450 [Myxococcota bacterium]|nr:cytochrome P450 [Myxococcota bacterium]